MATDTTNATGHELISAVDLPCDAWSKPVVSIRLSARRKGQLARLAVDLPAGSPPSAAIDAAIERALASPDELPEPLADRLAELEDAFVAAARDIKAHARSRDSHAAEAARSSKAILALISAASGNDNQEATEQRHAKMLPIAAWLEVALASSGAPARTSAIARGHWIGTRREGPSSARFEFEIALAAIDGEAIDASALAASPVLSEPVDIGGELFGAIASSAASPMFVTFRRAGARWEAILFTVGSDGGPACRLGPLPG